MTDKMAAYAKVCVFACVCVCVKWLVGNFNTLASAVEGVQLARLRPDFLNISNKLHKINRPREQTQCARAIAQTTTTGCSTGGCCSVQTTGSAARIMESRKNASKM